MIYFQQKEATGKYFNVVDVGSLLCLFYIKGNEKKTMLRVGGKANDMTWLETVKSIQIEDYLVSQIFE